MIRLFLAVALAAFIAPVAGKGIENIAFAVVQEEAR